MIIITSGAYVQNELRSEFGAVPPVYLPIGNQPLLTYQVRAIKEKIKNEHIALSLPESFKVTPYEQKRLLDLNIEVIRVPDGLSLAASILYAINMAGRYEEATRILHGDTLIYDLPTELDVLSVADSADDYDWYRVNNLGVWSGFFAFKHTRNLIRVLAKNIHFTDAILEYAAQYKLRQISTKDWLDFGHLNTYYTARELVTTQRAFNSLQICNGIVTKSGMPIQKIKAEAEWFMALPARIKPMTPAFYGKEENESSVSYSLEYLPMTPLNELYVYGRHSFSFWEQICRLYDNWFTLAANFSDYSTEQLVPEREKLIQDKTLIRLEKFSRDNNFDINKPLNFNNKELPSLQSIARECISKSIGLMPIPGVLHGDLCFSNVLYDARNRRIRVIDPRGVSNSTGLIGDMRYDLAKLMHSFIGLYDFIIAGHFSCERTAAYSWVFSIHTPIHISEIVQSFFKIEFREFPDSAIQESIADVILLFISMLPLHADNLERQEALMCNALRLYDEYYGK